jgi:hypothetical protein
MSKQSIDQRLASRYVMHIPVELLFDDGSLLRVLTHDISASGIFICVDRNFHLYDFLRFLITFPMEITTSCKIEALCDGVVVRRVPMGDSEGLAIKIQKYQFMSSQPR